MSSKNIKISEMESVIMDALEDYGEKASEVFQETFPKVGEEAAAELRQTSPVRTGDYAASWTFGMRDSRGSKKKNKLVVYNKDHYRIVHLLEKPHALRNGGRYEPENAKTGSTIHVKPVQDKAEKTAIERVKDKLENLGV